MQKHREPKISKKLVLSRETLKTLTSDELSDVRAGTATSRCIIVTEPETYDGPPMQAGGLPDVASARERRATCCPKRCLN